MFPIFQRKVCGALSISRSSFRLVDPPCFNPIERLVSFQFCTDTVDKIVESRIVGSVRSKKRKKQQCRRKIRLRQNTAVILSDTKHSVGDIVFQDEKKVS